MGLAARCFAFICDVFELFLPDEVTGACSQRLSQPVEQTEYNLRISQPPPVFARRTLSGSTGESGLRLMTLAARFEVFLDLFWGGIYFWESERLTHFEFPWK